MNDMVNISGGWDLIERPLSDGTEACASVSSAKTSLKAVAPGDVNDALVAAGRLPEPLTGLNFQQFGFVTERSWWWRRRLEVPAEFADAAEVELSLDGLDIHADIWFNGIHLGHHASSFYPFSRDVRKLLRFDDCNEILVRLTTGGERVSPDKLAGELASTVPTEANRGYPERGFPGRIWLRKPAYVWGWDWGPPLPTCGITGKTFLAARGSLSIGDVAMSTALSGNSASVGCRVEIERLAATTSTRGDVWITLTDADGCEFRAEKQEIPVNGGLNYFDLTLQLPSARLWWPNGSGEQHLYGVKVEACCADGSKAEKYFDYGVRTVRMVDEPGKFCFEINGVPIFIKGGNWIPPDSLYGRVSVDKLRKLVDEAAEANFNLLRVWGGGRYELDEFYDACDRRGIMLWHDFMSACAFLPADEPWFEHEFKREVDFQIRRLRNHASILLLCGNNEVGQFHEWLRPGTEIQDPGWVLYHRTIPRLCALLCPDIPYRPTSPYGGATTVHDPREGDAHHWIVMRPDPAFWSWPEYWDQNEVPIFNSEYGYGGPACITSTRQYMGCDTAELAGEVARQHTNTFYDQPRVAHSILEHYGETSPMPLERYILLGGLCQGLNLGYSLESQRANLHTEGAVFWMYNDTWGENGWTIVDYYLRRKISYYNVKRCLAPRRLVWRRGGQVFGGHPEEVLLIALNDSDTPLACPCRIGYLGYKGEKALGLQEVSIQVPPRQKAVAARLPVPDAESLDAGTLVALPLPEYGLNHASWRHCRFRDMDLPPGSVRIDSVQEQADSFEVTLIAPSYTHAVHLMLPDDSNPDDAYFDMLPGIPKIIQVPIGHCSTGDIKASWVDKITPIN